MSEQKKLSLIVSVFDSYDQADIVEQTIMQLDHELESVRRGNIAVVRHLSDDEVEFHETQDFRQNLSAIAGGLVGGLTNLLYAIIGGTSTSGYAFGARVENAVMRLAKDRGFPDDALYEVGEALQRGQSALIMLVAPDEEAIVKPQLAQLGGRLIQHELPPDIAADLINPTP
jgi:uncharacterized membrane protein